VRWNWWNRWNNGRGRVAGRSAAAWGAALALVALPGTTASIAGPSAGAALAGSVAGAPLDRVLAREPVVPPALAAVGAAGELPEAPAPSDDLLAAAASVAEMASRLGLGTAPPAGPLGIPGPVFEAYLRAEAHLAAGRPDCHIDWPLLASIGRIESGHARGGRVDAAGTTVAPILGPVLDGGPGIAAIHDTDGGRYDGDPVWDRAVGPMQFIPATWEAYGADGNGDGVRDPHNVFDAAVGAGRLLCAGGADLRLPDARAAAVFRYNHSEDYVRIVLVWADAYAQRTAVPTDPGPLAAALPTTGEPGAVATVMLVPPVVPPGAAPPGGWAADPVPAAGPSGTAGPPGSVPPGSVPGTIPPAEPVTTTTTAPPSTTAVPVTTTPGTVAPAPPATSPSAPPATPAPTQPPVPPVCPPPDLTVGTPPAGPNPASATTVAPAPTTSITVVPPGTTVPPAAADPAPPVPDPCAVPPVAAIPVPGAAVPAAAGP
jgi:hypothetical protein